MSPHAITPPSETPELDTAFLKKYAVTANGFVPAKAPLQRLPDPYYAPWEDIIHNLVELLETGTFRDKIDTLPVLDTDRLLTEQEWRRAYMILGFFTHSYIWGGDQASEILPPSVTIPILRVGAHLEVPPVATYSALNLWNFATVSPLADFSDLDSLRALHTFTGTPSESWFFMVSVAMETAGAHILPTMLRALDAIKRRDYALMTDALVQFSACIEKVGQQLERMYEGCEPDVFYHRIRPFLAGSKNMAAAGLPRGVFYDEGNGKGQWRQLRGGSNGQSSLIQFFDVVLGVEHVAGGNSNPHQRVGGAPIEEKEKMVPFHQEVRDYMPGPHRRFLEHAARSGSLRNLANEVPAVGASEEEAAFRDAFVRATRTLTEFRNKHLQVVTRYIVVPSRTAKAVEKGAGKVDLASASAGGATEATGNGKESAKELTGTGGTALMPFLKQSRDETIRAGQLVGA